MEMCLSKHIVSQGYIDVGKADRIEIVEFVVAFPAWLSADYDINEIGVYIRIFQAAYFIKTA